MDAKIELKLKESITAPNFSTIALENSSSKLAPMKTFDTMIIEGSESVYHANHMHAR